MRALIIIVIAAIAGFFGWKYLVQDQAVMEDASAVVSEAADATSDAAGAIVEGATDAVQGAADAASDAAGAVVEGATDAVQGAADMATDAVNAVTEGAAETATAATDAAAETATAATDAATSTIGDLAQALTVDGFDMDKVTQAIRGSNLGILEQGQLINDLTQAAGNGQEALSTALNAVKEALGIQ